jgi:hypothetical protein
MIEEYDEKDFTDIAFRLFCDYCEYMCEEHFVSFGDAVYYKKDRKNGWASVKDKHGDWQELCPTCNTPEIIAKLKGRELPAPRDESAALDLALKALEE